MRIEALLDPAAPRLQLLTGEDLLDRTVTGVMTTDLRDPGRYLHGGELVLTGMLWRTGPEDSERFVRTIAEGGAVALAAGVAEVGPVPDDLVAAALRHRVPLFSVPEDTAFGTITEYVVKQISADRASDLAALVERHRMLVSAAGGAGGLDAVLQLLGGDLDLDCWVIAPTGRIVAGPAEALPEARRQALARAALAALRRGRAAPYPVPGGGGEDGGPTFSVLPVPAEDAEPQPLADWLLVVAGDVTEWTPKRRHLAENLARLAGAERSRRDRGQALRARLADEVAELLRHDGDPGELARALDAAAAMAAGGGAGGTEARPSWLVVSAEGPGLPPYAVKAALAEALAQPAPRALVAAAGESGAIALVPAPGGRRPGRSPRRTGVPLPSGSPPCSPRWRPRSAPTPGWCWG
ncbi:PucR family transcriptional regulator ligand-binding domain-containing protein [Phaeacidiphilus oryzae]|uniref:PucR family transcriptional regulator ligand-binding domain-containing protein n=1 Tax=Phaeacidiphilus oryzae TaxID=348818 RepID=UPI000AC2A15D